MLLAAHWEKKQSCKESHSDTAFGMYSKVNRIMEFFVFLGPPQFAFNFSVDSPCWPVIHHFGREHTLENCLVNWMEGKGSGLSAFPVFSVSALLCMSAYLFFTTLWASMHRLMILTALFSSPHKMLHYVSLLNLQHSSETDLTLSSERFFCLFVFVFFRCTLSEWIGVNSINLFHVIVTGEAFWMKIGIA